MRGCDSFSYLNIERDTRSVQEKLLVTVRH